MKQAVIEEYVIDNQHFTRSIQISLDGGLCPQVFAINGIEIESEQLWLNLLHQARQRLPSQPATSERISQST